MSKTKGVTVDRRKSSKLSVSLASEDERLGVRSPNGKARALPIGRNRTLTAVATVAKAKGAKQSMIAQAEKHQLCVARMRLR